MTIRREDLAAIDFGDDVTGERLAHVTPGDVLRHEFMQPLDLSARALAREMQVPVTRITEILNGERTKPTPKTRSARKRPEKAAPPPVVHAASGCSAALSSLHGRTASRTSCIGPV